MSIYTVDKIGRKILLTVSIIGMGIGAFLIGGFFFGRSINEAVKSQVAQIVFMVVLMAAFCIGFGSIPRMMMCEIFPAGIKGMIFYPYNSFIIF